MRREYYAHLSDETIRELINQNRAFRIGMAAALRRHEEDVMLLNTALHELARRSKRNPREYMVRWYGEHRKLDLEGVPFTFKRPT